MCGRHLAPPHLDVVTNVSGELESELASLYLTHNPLLEVAPESCQDLVVTHGVVVGELSPATGEVVSCCCYLEMGGKGKHKCK